LEISVALSQSSWLGAAFGRNQPGGRGSRKLCSKNKLSRVYRTEGYVAAVRWKTAEQEALAQQEGQSQHSAVDLEFYAHSDSPVFLILLQRDPVRFPVN